MFESLLLQLGDKNLIHVTTRRELLSLAFDNSRTFWDINSYPGRHHRIRVLWNL
jgi:hypothetical protein